MPEGAAAATQIPTFKLVLVGDGGTGKVRPRDSLWPGNTRFLLLRSCDGRMLEFSSLPHLTTHLSNPVLTTLRFADYLR